MQPSFIKKPLTNDLSTKRTVWLSPAKLNLFLYITGRRNDGYHNLQTLFQLIDYYDKLYFTPRNDQKVQLITLFEGVDSSQNLIIKSANLLLDYVKQRKLKLPANFGFDITIDKKIPIGGGLGGGSSNAASTLIALNHLWSLNLTKEELMVIGKDLGADVPFFILGHNAYAEGIGEQLLQIDLKKKWYFVIKPNLSISTATIFNHANLKRDSCYKTLDELLKTPFSNDCEPIVKYLYPTIENIIALFSENTQIRLTGTGSCIFCECETKKQATQLQKKLLENSNIAKSIESSFIAKGLNKSPLIDYENKNEM